MLQELASSGPFISVIISAAIGIVSVVTSIYLTRLKNKSEIEKIQKDLEQKYAKTLFDKRLEHYPELYNLLSGYAKTIRYEKQSIENLKEFRDSVDRWNSKYSLYFTLATSIFSGRFRHLLHLLLDKNSNLEFLKENWTKIKQGLGYFEDLLKAEIGIFDTRPVGELKKVNDAHNFINSVNNEIERKLQLSQDEI